MTPILDSLPDEWEVLVWVNGSHLSIWTTGEQTDDIPVPDLGPHARFAAIEYATHNLIYVQDDDVIVSDPEQIVWESDSGGSEYGRLVCNMPPEFRPHYPDSAMVGFGAAFHRDLPETAFREFFAHHHNMSRTDPLFLRESCRIFTVLTPYALVDVAKTDMPYCSDDNRLWKDIYHIKYREEALGLAREVRDAS